MRLGLLDMIGLATTLVFALPVANFGVLRALDGEVLFGVSLVVVAVAMVVIPQYFFNPARIIRGLARSLIPGGSGDDDGPDAAEKRS